LNRLFPVATSLLSLALPLTTLVATSTPALARQADAPKAQKVSLQLRAMAGQTKRSQANIVFNGEFMGIKINRESKDISKSSFTSVAANGDITFESKTESSETTVNGVKEDEDPDKSTDTFTVRPNGTLVSFKTDKVSEEKDEEHIGERLFAATQVIFPDKPVGVGDKWTHEYRADSNLGTKAASGEFELLALETKSGVPCAKIKLTYKETEGRQPIQCKGTVWVEQASGDDVAAELELPDFAPGGEDGPTLQGSIKGSRIEGGPLTPEVAKQVLEGTIPEVLKVAQGTPATTTTVAAGPPKPKEKTIDDIVLEKGKEFEKIPGIVTLWRKKEPMKDTIYAEIREDQLDKLMFLQASASAGTTEQQFDQLPVTAGTPFRDLVFQFTRSPDDKLYVKVPNTYYRVKKGTPLEKAVKRSFSDSYLLAYKIEAKQTDRKSMLIDVSELFKSDLLQITQAFAGGAPGPFGGGAPGMGLDREKTYVTGVKNFPGNLVVNTQYAFARGSTRGAEQSMLADPRGALLQVTFNLSTLPVNNGYVPRFFDPRIGYFTTQYVSFDSDRTDELTRELILRWDIRKADPDAKVSEPEKPIVFWIDNATPTEYRQAVTEGLLVWNKAFERIGLRNVVQVKQMPDTPDPKLVAEGKLPGDVGDTRFNFVRWVISENAGYAVAFFRPNPLTGQILNASINVDGSLIQYFNVERNDIVEPAAAFARAAHSQAEIFEHLGLKAPLRQDLFSCRIGHGKSDAARFGWQALSLLGQTGAATGSKLSPLEYARQVLKETVAHEFGHILGLRHNFGASMQFSLAQLGDQRIVGQGGISASVMDYNTFNLAALKNPGVDFFSQTIGTYDYWAIEYGYKPAPKAPSRPEDEKAFLASIAKKAGKPGLSWLGDEASFTGVDPTVQTYDLTSDPIGYWEEVLKTTRKSLDRLGARLPKSGESYWRFTRGYNSLMSEYAKATGQISRFVGANRIANVHRGDAGDRPVLTAMPVSDQKRAVRILSQYLFAPEALKFPKEYYGRFTAKPGDLPGNFPVADSLSNLQKGALRRLLSGGVLAKVMNNEFKAQGGSEALTLPYLFTAVKDSVWAEAVVGGNVGLLRRNLQRQHAQQLCDMVLSGGVPDDARVIARAQLKVMQSQLGTALKKPGIDEMTKLHFGDTLLKIERTLTAQQTLGGNGGGGVDLLSLLMGGKKK
jgi:hypothetical protein